MTTETPETAPAEDSLFPGAGEIMDAARLPVTITPPEALNGDGQIPYAKADRVPEIALRLEAAVVEELERRRDPERDALAFTAGRLRMMSAASRIDEEDGPRYLVALFEILETEGGNRRAGAVVGLQWSVDAGGFDDSPWLEIGPTLDYADAATEYDALARSMAAGEEPPGYF